MNLLIALILMVFPLRPTQMATVTPVNVLRNSSASEGLRFWNTGENATIEQVEGNPCFVLRRGGFFQQTVSISEGHEDLYVVFVGRVLSEYVHADRAITDRPYLYGLALGPSERVLGYLQGDTMRGKADRPQQWETVYGIFHAPNGTTRIQFQLGQGLRKGVSHSGAAARFDDLVLYVVTDESAARAVAARHVTDAPIKLGAVTFPVQSASGTDVVPPSNSFRNELPTRRSAARRLPSVRRRSQSARAACIQPWSPKSAPVVAAACQPYSVAPDFL